MEAVKVVKGVLVLIPGQDRRALLSREQAEMRAHNVTPLRRFGKDGPALVEVNNDLHFKVGEVLGIDVGKARRDSIEPVNGGPLAKACDKVRETDEADVLSELLAADAAALTAAKQQREDEAKAAWTASVDLQKQFPDVATYLASLEPGK